MLLENFINGIRNNRSLASSWILFCCERNMAHEAGFLAQIVNKYSKVQLISQYGNDDYGWWTTKPEKTKYAYQALDIFATGNIVYMKDPICANPFKQQDKMKITKQMLEQQLTMYNPSVRESKNDLAFALTFNLYLWKLFLSKSISGLPYDLLYR
jgi:hypothetical protein